MAKAKATMFVLEERLRTSDEWTWVHAWKSELGALRRLDDVRKTKSLSDRFEFRVVTYVRKEA